MRTTFYVFSFVIGCLCGAGSFLVAHSLFDWQAMYAAGKNEIQTRTPLEYRHTGLIVSHDRTSRTITIEERSPFDVGTTTGQLRFSYDRDTRWSSQEHVLRDDVLVQRIVRDHEDERQLPSGTLVSLVRDPSVGSPWRIAEISFMRRTEL